MIPQMSRETRVKQNSKNLTRGTEVYGFKYQKWHSFKCCFFIKCLFMSPLGLNLNQQVQTSYMIHTLNFLFSLKLINYFLAFDSKTSMRCYSEKTGPKYQICDKSYGFQTCFTKYDDSKFYYSKLSWFFSNLWILLENQVVLRGCSSKRKMFHIECESHLSGTRNSLDMGEK